MCILLRRRGLSDLVGQGPRAQYTEGIHRKVLFSGVLTWLGLSQESESEHDLIITIKRGILAAQEGDLKRADQIFHVALKMANDIGMCHLGKKTRARGRQDSHLLLIGKYRA